jgi:hypothetical protein
VAISADTSPLEVIPDPEAIKARLAAIYAEARLLRPLLTLAERKQEAERRARERRAEK